MSARPRLRPRVARFAAGLAPFALAGLAAAAGAAVGLRPGRGLARRLAPRALRFAERVFPGITWLPLAGERFYRVRRLEHPRSVRAGEVFEVVVELENQGSVPWGGPEGSNPVRLGTWDPMDAPSPFALPEWVAATRPLELEAETPPSAVGRFRARFRAPDAPGTHRQALAPVAEGLCWFPGEPIVVEVSVSA